MNNLFTSLCLKTELFLHDDQLLASLPTRKSCRKQQCSCCGTNFNGAPRLYHSYRLWLWLWQCGTDGSGRSRTHRTVAQAGAITAKSIHESIVNVNSSVNITFLLCNTTVCPASKRPNSQPLPMVRYAERMHMIHQNNL